MPLLCISFKPSQVTIYLIFPLLKNRNCRPSNILWDSPVLLVIIWGISACLLNSSIFWACDRFCSSNSYWTLDFSILAFSIRALHSSSFFCSCRKAALSSRSLSCWSLAKALISLYSYPQDSPNCRNCWKCSIVTSHAISNSKWNKSALQVTNYK